MNGTLRIPLPSLFGLVSLLIATLVGIPVAKAEIPQRRPAAKVASEPKESLAKLRDDYVKATREYKASLEKLLTLYQKNVDKAGERLKQSQTLFAAGLISKTELQQSEEALTTATQKVSEVQYQLSTADIQIATTLLEAEANEKLARIGRSSNRMTTNMSYVRFSGGARWGLADAWKVQRFFEDAFKRPLPVAVFGQGAIHDRWRLDHRESIDVSLHPDGVEGQALLNFLRRNGIPFLAFRSAIPGTATGPHIHIGRPSHRY